MAKAPLTTSGLRVAWAPPCSTYQATFVFHSGAKVTCDPRVVPALTAMDEIMERWGYHPRPADTGMFVCRPITNGTGYSLHAYKIAVDVNWRSNPYFGYPVSSAGHTDMPIGMVNEIVGLRTGSGAPVWGWGGYYSSIRDFMHFEIVCTPADLHTGIVGQRRPLTDTQKAVYWAAAGKEAEGRPFLYPRVEREHPERIPFVRQVQQNLGIPVTGTYGPRTVRAVKAMQAYAKIDSQGVDGRMNRKSWQAMIYRFYTRNL